MLASLGAGGAAKAATLAASVGAAALVSAGLLLQPAGNTLTAHDTPNGTGPDTPYLYAAPSPLPNADLVPNETIAVPEPASFTLLLLGAGAAALIRRAKR